MQANSRDTSDNRVAKFHTLPADKQDALLKHMLDVQFNPDFPSILRQEEFEIQADEDAAENAADREQYEQELAWKIAEEEYNKACHAEEASKHFPAIPLPILWAGPRPAVAVYSKYLAYAGCITIVAGDAKAGKSTLMFHALNAVMQGKSFMWESTKRPQVVLYASEQPRISFFTQIEKEAKRIPELTTLYNFRPILIENNRLLKPVSEKNGNSYITVDRWVPPSSWDEQVEIWRAAIAESHATILVIDTLTAFSGFQRGEAADAGVVQARLQTLRNLLVDAPNLAIVILHHLRKEDNLPGGKTMVRTFADMANSYAFRAGSDQNVLIYKQDSNDENSHVRTIVVEGRFMGDKPTDRFQVELTPTGYQRIVAPVSADDLKRQEKDAEVEELAQMIHEHPEWEELGERKLKAASHKSERVIRAYREKYPKPRL